LAIAVTLLPLPSTVRRMKAGLSNRGASSATPT
jgi:hypothetical protein